MCARACVCVCACVIVITIVTGAPDTPTTWMRTQPQQTLHGLMVSIDERLHTLETARWDTTLKLMEQRMDSIETTIRRLDSAFRDRLNKLERSLNSKELKDELTVEKLSHKIRDILDSSYDRYNRRLGFTEERLEMALKKVHMSVDASFTRIEKQEEDVQAEVMEAITLLEDLKSQSSTTEDKLNSTHKAMQQHIQRLMSPNQEELQKISGSLEHLGSRLNSSLAGQSWNSQNDGPLVGDVLTTIRKEINIEGTKFSNKVNNMYNDLWRRMGILESLVKDLSRQGNTTQHELLEEVRSLALNDHRDFPGDSHENFLEVALDALERKLQRRLLDLGRKVDDRLDTLSATQNMVMDSCFDGGICRDLENRLSQVLEKIFVVFSNKIEGFSNRTFDLDSLVLEMMELVKSQHSALIRTISHNTNMVVTLTKDSSDANKLLQNSVTQLAEKSEYNFQELHDEVQEIANTSGKVCTENDKTNEETTDHQLLPDTPRNKITEVQFAPLNMTHETQNKTKHHDTGVLKITTDDINILADNTSLPRQAAASPALAVDSSILKVISVMSPNLTQGEVETLMRFLNRSVSLENLEAIIQNTEAESEDDGLEEQEEESLEESFDDIEAFNTTKVKDGLIHKFYTKLIPSSENFEEIENISEETIQAGPNQNETTQTIGQNTTKIIETGIQITSNQTETKYVDTPTNLKDQIKVYALLMKIKHGNLNNTELWKEIQKVSNQSKDQSQQTLLPLLQKLCFGVETTQGFEAQFINSVMRNRLLLINQTINDTGLYEKIENVCNTMTEAMMSQSESEEFSDD